MPITKSTSGQTKERKAEPSGPDSTRALNEVIRDYSDVKRHEWRPRRNATVARRLGRFEEAIKRNADKLG
jgi:hypothetical protein